MEGRPTATASIAVYPLILSLSEKEKTGPLSSAALLVPRGLLLLLQWGGDCFATPELVGQDHAHRVDVHVVIQFEASGA
jgi:hypothetical protein